VAGGIVRYKHVADGVSDHKTMTGPAIN
jgi:hypothetical protein